MGKISARQRSYLEGRFGSRVSFRKTERKLYGHPVEERVLLPAT